MANRHSVAFLSVASGVCRVRSPHPTLAPDMPAPRTPTYANTVPVMERHRFDAGSLDRYLHAHLDSYRGGLEVRQFDSMHSHSAFSPAEQMQGGKRQTSVL